MQFIFRYIFRNLSFYLFIFLVLFAQLLFIQTNITGIFLFSQLLFKHDLYRTAVIAVIISVIYDSVTLNAIGLWAFSFFLIALLLLILSRILKLHDRIETISWLSLTFLTLLISLATVLQAYFISQFAGHKTFDFNTLYSIVGLSSLNSIYNKITARPDKLALPE